MNHIVMEAAKEAGLYTYINGMYPTSLSAEQCNEAYEKFANILISKAADYVKYHANFTYAGQADLCAARIKERFGVK